MRDIILLTGPSAEPQASVAARAGLSYAGRMAALEGLRGLMALWVVVGHTLWACGYDGAVSSPALPVWLAVHPQLAVQVFMILSGFVITLSVLERPMPWPAFLLRRALRLYPAYLVALAAALALAGPFDATWHDLPFADPRQAVDQTFMDAWVRHPWPDVAQHLFMLHGVIERPATYAILIQTWSLSVEWQFYVLAPALGVGLAGRRGGLVLLAGVALTTTLAWAFPQLMLAANAHYFWLGIVSCLAWRHPGFRAACAGVPGSAVLGVAVLVVASTHFTQVPLIIWLLVFGSVLTGATLQAPLLSRTAQFLGRVSYSLYLSHLFGLLLALRLLTPWAVALGRPAFAALVLVGTVAVSLPLAMAMFAWVERPGIRFARALS